MSAHIDSLDIQSLFEELDYLTNRQQISSMELEICKMELKQWCMADNIPQSTLRNVISLWRKSRDFPSLELILDDILENGVCHCWMDMPRTEKKVFARHFMVLFGRIPECQETYVSRQYFIETGTYPNVVTLTNMINRLESMRDSSSNFFQDDKVVVPVKNLGKIKEIPFEGSDVNCGICQESLTSGQMCYELSPCQHKFHSKGTDCLEGHTITEWMKINHYCPICRKDIIIE